MDFSKFVYGSVYYVGMFLVVLFVSGWRLLAIGAISGAVVFPILFGGRQPFIVELLLGAVMGFFLSWLGSLGKEKLRPYLRAYIDPDSWDTETERAAGLLPLSPEERSVRWTLVNSAAAGSSSAGLLSVWISETLNQELSFQQLLEQFSGWLLTTVVITWVGVSLFSWTSGKSDKQGAVQSGTWAKVGFLALLLTMSQDIIKNLIEKGFQIKDGIGIWILLVNSLTAGAVTYYWTAGTQLRQRSIAWRAALSSSILGGMMMFPPAFIFFLKIFPFSFGSSYLQGEILFSFLVTIILAALISFGFGVFLFGMYAFAGGSAIRFGGAIPAALRVLLGLIPVAAFYMIFLYGLQIFLRQYGTPDHKSLPLEWKDWFHPFTGVLGWSLGLWSNQKFKRVVESYSRWRESDSGPSPVPEDDTPS
jgi:hypothetical protein